MDSRLFEMFSFLILFMICHRGWGLRMEISPSPVKEFVTDQVNITCTTSAADDGGLKEIVVLEVSKDGGKPLAILKLNSPLEIGAHVKSNVQASGRIANRGSGGGGGGMTGNAAEDQSFISLTILEPGLEHSGTYTCLMYYIGALGPLEEQRESGNLTVEEVDTRTMGSILMDKIKDQDEEIRRQKSKVNILEELVKQQQTDMTKQRNQLDSWDETVRKLDSWDETARKLELVVGEQNRSLDAQHDKIRELERELTRHDSGLLQEQHSCCATQNDTLTVMEHRLDGLGTLINKQSDWIRKHGLLEPVAFHAGYDYYHKDKFGLGEVVIFSYVLFNQGGGYNASTGFFHAPKTGLYVFNLVGTTENPGTDLYIDLVANHVTQGRSYIIDDRYGDQSGVNCVVKLMKGEEVKPVVTTMHERSALESFPYSWFSGYLITPL